VEVGIVNPDRTEILFPSIEGAVVSLGQHLLQEGSTVILPERVGGSGRTQSGESGSQADSVGAPGE
jgi:hypothetical protein